MDLYDRTRELERRTDLDGLVRLIDQRIPGVLMRDGVRERLAGQPLGHALHPMLTDAPIGAWLSATLIDLFGPPKWRRASRLLTGIGLAAFLPTLATGLVEFRKARPKEQRVIAVHAAANAVSSVFYTASFLAKRSDRRRAGAGYALLGAAFLGVGGYLGGHLTYVLGVGVDPHGRQPVRGDDPEAMTAGTAPVSGSSDDEIGTP